MAGPKKKSQPRTPAAPKGKQKAPELTPAEKIAVRKSRIASAARQREEEGAESRRILAEMEAEQDDSDEDEETRQELEEEEEAQAADDDDEQVAEGDNDDEQEASDDERARGAWANIADLGLSEKDLTARSKRRAIPPPPSSEVDEDEPEEIEISETLPTPRRPGKKRQAAEISPVQDKPPKRSRQPAKPGGSSSQAPSRASSEAPSRKSSRAPSRASSRSPSPTPRSRKHKKGGAPRRRREPDTRKVTSRFFTDLQNDFLDGGKQAFRASAVLDDAFPEIGRKSAYYTPILEAFVETTYARASFKEVLKDFKESPEVTVMDDVCTMCEYAVGDGIRRFLPWCRDRVDIIVQPDGVVDSEITQMVVAFHKKTKAFHHSKYDSINKTFVSTTAFKAPWITQVIRRWLYVNKSGLDGFATWRVDALGGPTMELVALICTSMLHCIIEWEEGTFTEHQFGTKLTKTQYEMMLCSLQDIDKKVPGWWAKLSKDIYLSAARQSNKEWRINANKGQTVNQGIDYEAMRAELAAEVAVEGNTVAG